MTPATRDGIGYLSGAIVGSMLGRSIGGKVLGVLIGGTAGLVVASWLVLSKVSTKTTV